MKIALCISGFMRSFEEVFPSLQQYFLLSNDADIFIHTWNKSDRHTDFLDVNKVKELYRPKAIIVEGLINLPTTTEMPKKIFTIEEILTDSYLCIIRFKSVMK